MSESLKADSAGSKTPPASGGSGLVLRTLKDGTTFGSVDSSRGAIGTVWLPLSRRPDAGELAECEAMLRGACEGKTDERGVKTYAMVCATRFLDLLDSQEAR